MKQAAHVPTSCDTLCMFMRAASAFPLRLLNLKLTPCNWKIKGQRLQDPENQDLVVYFCLYKFPKHSFTSFHLSITHHLCVLAKVKSISCTNISMIFKGIKDKRHCYLDSSNR